MGSDKIPKLYATVGARASKCYEGLYYELSSGLCYNSIHNRTHSIFNMSSVEDILDEVLLSDDDRESEQLHESSGPPRTTDVEGNIEAEIVLCLEVFDKLNLENNLCIFKESVRQQIKGSFQAFKPPTDPLKILLNTSLNCGSLFKTESKLWLQKMYFRLTGRPSIRNPYQCEIQRNIPVDLFHCLKRALQHSRVNNITDHVTYEERSKDDVISFISKQAVVGFLSLLSGLDESDVKKYFKKYLTGRVNGKATIIVNTRKKFEFIYRKKSLQLCIVFHYGVWNKAGFPLHN